MKKTILAVLTLALSVASAKTYPVTITQPTVVAGNVLKPGEYSLDLQDNNALLKRGSVAVKCTVRIEKAGQKYSSSSVRLTNRDGKTHLAEIRLGGTDMKLVVD
jgi:hypothetical protein